MLNPFSPRTALIQTRIAAGFTRAQLAAKLGINLHFLVMVENGRRDPSFPLMQRWIDALGKRASLVLFELNPPGMIFPTDMRGRRPAKPAEGLTSDDSDAA